MRRRAVRAVVLVGLVGVAYAVKVAGDRAPDWFAEMGSIYDCPADEFYTGRACQKRLYSSMYSPPCPYGWQQVGSRCIWRDDD